MDFSVEVVSFTVKIRIIFNNELNKQVPIWPTTWASWASISQAHLRSRIDSRGDF
jgi:hypothetical protein